MLATQPRKLQIYQHPNGREPFTEWWKSIRDRNTRSRLQERLVRLERGNVGDCKSIGEGIFESRFHFGAGYRIYFGIVGNTIILLLAAAISPRRHGTLNAQKPIGKITRRPNDGKNEKIPRFLN